ncbi:MAG: N-acetyl-gamma-glutamyl-phosphate reductase [Gammaproteobacteria bacterium]|nr:N-acetyl-gamma-glutamyl-phosphate reductase [Gammaproteobacteria bacterium]
MPPEVFIDGAEGTTGIELYKRLESRSDLNLLQIDPDLRKDIESKRQMYERADVVVLCLPDEAAREAIELSSSTRFLDASTAHRTSTDWIYGLPELAPAQRTKISNARLVSNPGCYPTGFLLSIRPLVDAGILPSNRLVRSHALSGYSGGGKKLIDKYKTRESFREESRPYATTLQHKHLAEMQFYSGLNQPPLFEPMVGAFFQGMLVQTPLFAAELNGYSDPETILDVYRDKYAQEPFIKVYETETAVAEGGYLSPQSCNGTNRIDLMAFGHSDQVSITARLDNLGKGAAAAAVQNLNLMLGLPEETGLTI